MSQPDRILYTGTCRGGPLDGHEATSRAPGGLLVVDRPNNRCWLYAFCPSGAGDQFIVREHEGRELDHDKRMAAVEDPRIDIVAVP